MKTKNEAAGGKRAFKAWEEQDKRGAMNTACKCGKIRPWGYTCGSCSTTINEAWVTKVQGEKEAKAYKSLHDAAPTMLAALKDLMGKYTFHENDEAMVRAAIAKAEVK